MLIALLCIALLASALDYWATNASREAELKGNNSELCKIRML